jgi:hypothetical protein
MTGSGAPHHANHDHEHRPGCGHTAVRHGGHVDDLHDGHLHDPHGTHVDQHVIEVSETNPDRFTAAADTKRATSTAPAADMMRRQRLTRSAAGLRSNTASVIFRVTLSANGEYGFLVGLPAERGRSRIPLTEPADRLQGNSAATVRTPLHLNRQFPYEPHSPRDRAPR